MTYAEEMRRLYAWSVRTQRLIGEAISDWAKDQRGPMTKQEAIEIAEKAKAEAERRIAADLEANEITKRKASAAKRALTEYHANVIEGIKGNPKLL